MNSIWTQTTKLPAYPARDKDLRVDTLVIGGGLTGLLCGFFLYEQNADYAIIEQHNIAGHTTAYTTAKITTQHGLIYSNLMRYQGHEIAEGYYMANKDGIDKYRQIIRDYDIDCDWEPMPNLIYDLHDRQAILDELKALEAIKGKGIYIERPEGLPLAIKAGIVTPKQAQFHPLKFARAIAQIQEPADRQAQALGEPSKHAGRQVQSPAKPHSHIYEETKAVDIQKDGTGYAVSTINPYTETAKNNKIHTIYAKRVIIATHFPFKNIRGLYFMKMHQARSYAILLGNIQQDSLPRYMSMGSQPGDLSFRTFNGSVASHSHPTKLILGGRGGKTGKVHGGYNWLMADAKKLYPGCTIEKLWATQDCMTLDQMPYIGNHNPSYPGVKVATGFNKWGMTSAMVAALILTGQMDRDISDIFYPHRSMIHPQVIVNGVTSAANLLKPRGPRCSHLGCTLKWNQAEQSWDCPCHGSRYNQEGNVLNEPAPKPIQPPSKRK